MSFHLNKVLVSGTLTRDPETKYTPKGTAITNFSLACNRRWRDDNGKEMEETTFVECVAFGRTAEVISEWTKKGHTIFIEGRLKLDQWDDKETGKKRSRLSVVCEKMSFVDKPKGEKEAASQRQEKPSRPAGRPSPPSNPDLDPPQEDDDGIPF